MDEHTPLLSAARDEEEAGAGNDIHRQFCLLVGMKSSDAQKDPKQPLPGKSTLYGRVVRKRRHQNWVYMFTSSLSNSLLLTQVVLGAALTALGASESSHILITIFGAMNTVIAGLVAYLKSRGQPMRARMFRDDLDRVIDEIENSEIMWLGISKDVHGYDEIAIDDSVSVRSEVARLTRLYDKAVRGNTANDPDMYQGSTFESVSAALRNRPGQQALPAPPATAAQPAVPASAPTPAAPEVDSDSGGPATAPPKPKEEVTDSESAKGKGDSKSDSNDATDDSPAAETDGHAASPKQSEQDVKPDAASKQKDGIAAAPGASNDSGYETTQVDSTAGADDSGATAGAAAPASTTNAHDPDDSPATRR